MIIFPAIDLRRGRCVRLRQGDPAAETVFGDDPAAMARHWADSGAPWLHVVNLDGALGDQRPDAPNLRRLAEIRAAVTLPIQFGGGLRTLGDVALALELGATRVVLGTAVVQQPALAAAAVERFGAEAIVAGLDVRAGLVATHGWQSASGLHVHDLGRRLRRAGLLRAVYTDIARDGMLSGVDADGSAELARQTGLRVIASGGVRDLSDIERLKALEDQGIEGVIVGQAIYTGSLNLAEAVALVGERSTVNGERCITTNLPITQSTNLPITQSSCSPNALFPAWMSKTAVWSRASASSICATRATRWSRRGFTTPRARMSWCFST